MSEKNKEKVLLKIYLKNDSIEYDFNESEEETIIANSLLLYGILGKIQKNLLDLDANAIPEQENAENNEEGGEENNE